MAKMIRNILIPLIVIIIGSVFYFVNANEQSSKVNYNSKAMPAVKATPSASSIKMLDLKGNSSIIITIYPSIINEESYLIELFDNGTIETSVGLVNEEAFFGEFKGTKDEIFKEVIYTRQRTLLESEIEEINEMISRINLEKYYKRYSEKEVAIDADTKMIWIGNKAYYFLGALPSKNKLTKLIDYIAKCSPIKVEVRSGP